MKPEAAALSEEWLAHIAKLDLQAQLALVQRVLAGVVTPTLAAVREAALKLPPSEQAQLAQQLLLSLADLPQAQLEATLEVEARRRAAAEAQASAAAVSADRTAPTRD